MRSPFLSRFNRRFASTRGAIDLASIMVGVIVMGVIGGIIAAAVFAVIPWSQDKAAAQNLDGVKLAESVSYAKDGTFANADGLANEKLLSRHQNVKVAANPEGTCWVATSESATGKVFVADSEDMTTRTLSPSEATTCADLSYEPPATPLAVSIWVHNPHELSEALATAPAGAVIGLANAISHTVTWNGATADGPIFELGSSRQLILELNGQQLSVDARGGIAAIAVPGDSGITIHDNTRDGKATLRAESAGIGGSATYGIGMSIESVGTVTIDHARIDAENVGWGGAAIGGGPNSLAAIGTIRILNGSNVVAEAQNSINNAGIGAGWGTTAPTIEIDGSTVEAVGGPDAAGIGGCGVGEPEEVPNGDISIRNSVVTATGGGAGIGSGVNSRAALGTITISDSTINARSGSDHTPAIGGSSATTGGHIEITGHSVITAATRDRGGDNAEFIGNGQPNPGTVTVNISPDVEVRTSLYL